MDFLLTKFDKSWDTPTNLHEKMKDLKRKQAELNALKGDTKSTTAELHPRKKLKKEVELWLENVERINGEIQDLEQKIGENSFTLRGFLKANVLKKIQEVDELYQRGKFHNSLVVDNPGWIGQALSTTTLFGGAAKTCMEEIWAHLLDDDIQKIGVWGMGGIGKTTIVKLVHNQLLKETERFDIVIWITVSKEMNIIKLQNRIARAMKASLDEDEDETIRAGMIYEMLACKGKYVLILDDLWEKLSLEEVGIPEPSNGSKLLVTTRLLDVCHYLHCREVRVPTLSNPDAWSLFLKKVGEDVSNYPILLPIMELVAKECDGLPLAIVTIASSMRGVRAVHAWRDALHELKRNGETVKKMEEKVFQQLQFSYDRLRDEEQKNCFLCCALFPEDWEIETDELIHLWIAEGHVKEMDSMQQEIDKGRTILDELKSSCLIENGYTGEGRVRLHDVLRDMALRITSVRPRFLVRAGMQLKRIADVRDWNEDLEKASFMMNWQLQIPSQMPPPKCQKLTTLLLSRCHIESIPECFFEQMHGLKILDLSCNPIKSLPNSISNLETLTTLLLRWCEQLGKVPSFSKLQALKKLDLSSTNIKDIPHGMERLVNLKYLDLNYTQITEMADGILVKLTSLQHLAALGAYYRHKLFVRGEEIGGLRELEFFEGCFSDLNEWNSCAQGLHARERWPRQYIIYVGHQYEWDDFHGDSKKAIGLRGCDMICTIGIKILSDVEVLNIREYSVDLCEEESLFSWFIPVPHNKFSSLSWIDIRGCGNIKKLFSSNWVLHNLQNLNTLRAGECWDMEEIIASESEVEGSGNGVAIKLTLPRLKKLELWDLPKLKSICGANGVVVCDSIVEIFIRDCPKLKRIPLNLPLQDDCQPSPPSSLTRIQANPEWWESVEWDHPHAKSLLEPYFNKSDWWLPVRRNA